MSGDVVLNMKYDVNSISAHNIVCHYNFINTPGHQVSDYFALRDFYQFFFFTRSRNDSKNVSAQMIPIGLTVVTFGIEKSCIFK